MRVALNGSFKTADVRAAAAAGSYPEATYHWKEAAIRLPLSDVRSIRELNATRLGQHPLIFGPAQADGLSGVEAKIDLSEYFQDASVPFSAQMVLAGSQAVAFLPTAGTTQAKLDAGWPDPQFQGDFLPAEYSIDDRGFHAEWQVLALNRDFPQSWVDSKAGTPGLTSSAFGAALYQSVDVYQRSERAVKYALLFIVLTFLSFFAWESVARLRIHPMQYLLIGLALSSFYLLLIALSEHVPFWLSYVMGAMVLVALLGFYMAGVMDDVRPGVMISVVMSLVYGVLYVLVVSENYSLLIGAIVLFGVLATIMIGTRKLHWEADPGRP
jgi:inner membrane protein